MSGEHTSLKVGKTTTDRISKEMAPILEVKGLSMDFGGLRALDQLENLDALLPEPGLSPLQLAKLKGKTRQRASGSRGSDD